MKNMHLDSNKIDKLDKLISVVSNHLASINATVPFFIAGGSVFSILQAAKDSPFDTHQSHVLTLKVDFDVFFYNEHDFNTVESAIINSQYITKNAISILYKHNNLTHSIQYIQVNFGTMSEVLSQFDINCSKVAYSSEKIFYAADDFSTYIKLMPEKIHAQSYIRYIKYTQMKGAIDYNKKELYLLIDFYIKNWNIELLNYYESEKDSGTIVIPIKGSHVLAVIFNYYKISGATTQYIHDEVVNNIKGVDRVDIFVSNFYNRVIKSPCIEYLLSIILSQSVNATSNYINPTPDDIHRVKLKYPEYML